MKLLIVGYPEVVRTPLGGGIAIPDELICEECLAVHDVCVAMAGISPWEVGS